MSFTFGTTSRERIEDVQCWCGGDVDLVANTKERAITCRLDPTHTPPIYLTETA